MVIITQNHPESQDLLHIFLPSLSEAAFLLLEAAQLELDVLDDRFRTALPEEQEKILEEIWFWEDLQSKSEIAIEFFSESRKEDKP